MSQPTKPAARWFARTVAVGIIEWVAFLVADFQQRPQLWHKVEVPKLGLRSGSWQELDQTEQLRHRRDAFFTLSLPRRQGTFALFL